MLKPQQGKHLIFLILSAYYNCFYLQSHHNLYFFRLNKSEIEAEFERLVMRLQHAKTDTLKQEDLKEQMEDFLEVMEPS